MSVPLRFITVAGLPILLLAIAVVVLTNNRPAAASTIEAITAGDSHTCVLTTSGGVKCWGRNADGQLGDGTASDSTVPIPSGLTSNVKALSAGNAFTCALTSGTAVKCWGYNGYGQLGNGSNSGPDSCSGDPCSKAPVDVCANGATPACSPGTSNNLTGVSAISAGGYHACALTTGGQVLCWGYNGLGELGDGTTTDRTKPVYVCADASCTSFLSGVSEIAAGGEQTCALLRTTRMKCWGRNDSGELGNGTDTGASCGGIPCHTTPVDVCNGIATPPCSEGNGNLLELSVGVYGGGAHQMCALGPAGILVCWGRNDRGELGLNTSSGPDTCNVVGFGSLGCSTQPATVCADSICTNILDGVVGVALGSEHTCALAPEKSPPSYALYCWGHNEVGELGNGITTGPQTCGPDSTPCSTYPVQIFESDVSGVASGNGSAHTCAIVGTSDIECWGYNASGQLGISSTTDSSIPVGVAGLAPKPTATPTPTPTCPAGKMDKGGFCGTPTATPTPAPPAMPPPLLVPCPIAPNNPFPDPGCDALQMSGTFTAHMTAPVTADFTCSVSGDIEVARYHNPFTPFYPRPTNPTLRGTDAEILFMYLPGSCTGTVPGTYPIILQQAPDPCIGLNPTPLSCPSPYRRSLGAIAEQAAGSPGFWPAFSFFDAFFSLNDIVNSRTLHNTLAATSICEDIIQVPITGCIFFYFGPGGSGAGAPVPGGSAASSPPPLPVFDQSNVQVGTLTDASLTPQAVDSDMDGCSDTKEQQANNQTTGGQRNPHNFWDYGDMPNNNGGRDKKIRISDVSAVVQRYGTDDNNGMAAVDRYTNPLSRPSPTGYHPAFDRGGVTGAHPWSVAPPDGKIRISDISYVVQQYRHDCL